MSTSQATGRKPSHRLFHVTGEADASNWIEIGAAWPNKDGKGFNLLCDVVPLSGRIVMRELLEREDPQGEAQ